MKSRIYTLTLILFFNCHVYGEENKKGEIKIPIVLEKILGLEEEGTILKYLLKRYKEAESVVLLKKNGAKIYKTPADGSYKEDDKYIVEHGHGLNKDIAYLVFIYKMDGGGIKAYSYRVIDGFIHARNITDEKILLDKFEEGLLK